MVEDRISALEERVAALEGARDGWDPARPEAPRAATRSRWETTSDAAPATGLFARTVTASGALAARRDQPAGPGAPP